MLNRAEFGVGSKVTYWNKKKFIPAVVSSLQLNPIENIVEYRLFFTNRSEGSRGKRFVNTLPYQIKESSHFKR